MPILDLELIIISFLSHQLLIKNCSNIFPERSFTYAAPCEWNKLTEHIRTSNVDCFRRSVKTMLFTQQYECGLTATMYTLLLFML